MVRHEEVACHEEIVAGLLFECECGGSDEVNVNYPTLSLERRERVG